MGRRADPAATVHGASAPWSRGWPPGRPTRAAPRPSTGSRRACGRRPRNFATVGRGHHLHQPREVVRAAGRRQRPHVLEPEVASELVDPPGPGGVRTVREPHLPSLDSLGAVLILSDRGRAEHGRASPGVRTYFGAVLRAL